MDETEEAPIKGKAFFCYISCLIVKTTSFALGIDPFLIYKSPNITNKRKRIHNSSELHLKFNHVDKLREGWITLLCTWVLYFVFKFSFLCINQINRRNKSKHNRWKEPIDFMEELSSKLGDPLNLLTGLSIYMYSSISINLFLGIIIFYYNHKRNPLDIVDERLLLDPIREHKRIDAIIVEWINYFKDRANNRVDKFSEIHYRVYYKGVDFPIPKSELEMYNRILDKLESNISIMRPAIHQKNYYPKHIMMMFISIYVTILLLVTPVLIIPYQVIVGMRNSRCDSLESIECKFSALFTWREYLTSAELILSMILLYWIVIYNIALIFGSVFSQYKSISDLSRDLKTCLINLRIGNDFPPDEDLVSSYWSEHLTTISLKFLIKLLVTEDEIRNSSVFKSRVLTNLLTINGVGLIMSLIGGKIEDEYDLQANRTYLIIWLLIMTNLILFACAYHHANSIKLDKILWSINAQLVIQSEKQAKPFNSDIVTSTWCKLAYGHSVNNTRNSIRFFGVMAIDYRRLLELNFVLASFASLLRTL